MTQVEGWYPDPAGKAETFRWWDGATWTRFLSAEPDAPAPIDQTQTALTPTGPGLPDPVSESPTAETPEPETPEPETPEPQTADEPRVRLAVAVGTVVAVLLVAIVAVGAVVTASTRQLPEGPANTPDLQAAVSMDYDLATRQARVGEVSATMPAAPYTCESDQALTPTFSVAAVCNALVTKDYKGTEDWYAGLGFGLLSDDLAVDGDLKATARNLFDSLQTQFYADEVTTPKNFLEQELTDIPTTKAVALAGELHYDVDGVPSRFDKVLVIVVKLDSGKYVAWFSARPDGMSEDILDRLNDSLASFVIRS